MLINFRTYDFVYADFFNSTECTDEKLPFVLDIIQNRLRPGGNFYVHGPACRVTNVCGFFGKEEYKKAGIVFDNYPLFFPLTNSSIR